MTLPVNLDASYPDSGDPSRKLHQQHHDALHAAHNALAVLSPESDVQAALNLGGVVRLTAGTYAEVGWTIPSNTHLILDPGAVLQRSTAGTVLTAAGSEATGVPLTVTAAPGNSTITAPGHGLVAEDVLHLTSTLLFDSFNTNMNHGEILFVRSVAGDVITLSTPVIGGPYTAAASAVVRKVTPVRNIRVSGSGTVLGDRTPALAQIGLQVTYGINVRVDGVTFKNIDQTHVKFNSCVDAHVMGCTFDWATTTSQAYGVSFADCTQDSSCTHSTFLEVRHSLSTNNSTAGDGIPRRILFAFNTVRLTSNATGGSMGGGDAIDTHGASEDIDVLFNTVLGSAGQGINMECRSGRIVGNVIRDCVSNGIAFHNESDLDGRVEVSGNDVQRVGGLGVSVRPGFRGTTAALTLARVQDNYVDTCTGSGVQVGAVGGPSTTSALVTGNTARNVGGTYAVRVENATATRQANNAGLTPGTTTTSFV